CVVDCAIAIRPDDVLQIRRYREPAIYGDLVICLDHRLGSFAGNITAEGAVDHSCGNDVVVAAGNRSLITQTGADEIGHDIHARFRCEGGVPPNRQAFLATGLSIAVNHLLKHSVYAVGTALDGIRFAQISKSVAVIEAAKTVNPRQTSILGR